MKRFSILLFVSGCVTCPPVSSDCQERLAIVENAHKTLAKHCVALEKQVNTEQNTRLNLLEEQAYIHSQQIKNLQNANTP